MKIHFCDLCNESVPQADLDQGRAILRKGRVICATCDRAMSPHVADAPVAAPAVVIAEVVEEVVLPPSPPEPVALPVGLFAHEPPPALTSAFPHHASAAARREGSGGLWLAVLGLLFTAGTIFVLDERIQDVERRAADTSRLLQDRTQELLAVQHHATELADAQRDVERRVNQRITDEKARREGLSTDLARIQQENSDLSARLAALGTAIASLEQKSGSGSFDLEKRFAALSARVAHGEDEARALAEKITAIETAPPVVAAAEPTPAAAAAPETAWHQQLEGLKSDSDSARWEAVTALGATKDPQTLPYLTPMLKDKYLFVRMATARVLGEMGFKSSVPALIDALDDEESAVREAVNLALRTITGKDFKFDPLAIDAERARRVKAWRDWWKKEGEPPSGM
jgi:hypothetical protein